jgi:hypothetical protein
MAGGETESDFKIRRAVGVVLMVLLLFVVMFGLQGMFDAADRKKAVQAVLAWRPGGEKGTTIGEALLHEAGGDAGCDAAITSGCWGTVRVRCAGKDREGVYEFDVDLVKSEVRPAGGRARTLAEQLAR